MLTPIIFRNARPARSGQGLKNAEKVRNYVLEVTFKVTMNELNEFARQSAELIPTFTELGLFPKNSAWVEEESSARVFNYWDLGSDANQLLEAELALPDIPRFNTFNIIVREEVKNLVISLASDEVRPLELEEGEKLSRDKYYYLRVESTVSNANFSEFVARVEGYICRFTHEAGWFLGDTYYGITGKEGSVSQLWIVPAASIPNIGDRLAKAPWGLDGIAGNQSWRVLAAAPADPNFA